MGYATCNNTQKSFLLVFNMEAPMTNKSTSLLLALATPRTVQLVLAALTLLVLLAAPQVAHANPTGGGWGS